MGLDTVELLMEMERFFKITIGYKEAEQIGTIQEMSLCVAKHLNIVSDKNQLQQEMFFRIQHIWSDLATCNRTLHLEDPVAEVLNLEDTVIWKKFEEQLKLSIPKPKQEAPKFNLLRSINKWLTGNPSYQWNEINWEYFIDTFCAVNYNALIDVQKLRDRYDILVGVSGITIRVTGIDPYEVRAEKSFTDDLGMD